MLYAIAFASAAIGFALGVVVVALLSANSNS